ncbi:PHD finger protein 12-like isoform X1 [Salvelinus fontinalis]|uniref:PHD finger protein 12-like isoform X1 n=1 Tax=Salvelinus fontinalis TaxID=8038 RepID=UPI0024858277|nr:PHD finger protein 12-like isoform X1 [Salvelinus fontinalis]
MLDKMETPTIVYDLDTSGGLMEQIQTLLAPPKSEDGEKRNRRSERDVRRKSRATNHDTCDSCHEGGDLLCCDHCPAAFHLQCCNPPLSEEMLPPGDWMCHRCNFRRKKREQKAEPTNGLLERERPLSKRSSPPAAELERGTTTITTTMLRLDRLPPGVGAAGPGLRVAAVRLERLERQASSQPGTPTSNTSSMDMATPLEEQNEADAEMAKAEEVVVEAQGSEPERATTTHTPTPRLLKRPFQLLIAAAMERNPSQFQLPNELTCTTALPGSTKQRRKEELIMKTFRRPQHEMDPNGLVPLPVRVCFSCTRNCRMAPLVQCDYCPLLFHMDCLDPPLTAMPTGRWMCPNHMEHLVLNRRSLSLTSRCKLLDQFQDRISQHAVKVDFLRWVHRQNPPVLSGVHHKTKALKVPDAIKSQYKNPPAMLAPAAVRNGELICNGIPNQDCSPQHFTSQAEQQEWLRDVMALQCSIMRHLSGKQKSSSDLDSEQTDVKPCVALEENSTLPLAERTASALPVPCSKPCNTSDGSQGAPVLKELSQGQESCCCTVRPCLKCRKPNGPLMEQPVQANGTLACDAASGACRQTELQLHILTPQASLPISALGLPNHLRRGVVVKTERGSPLESCTQRGCSPSKCAATGQDVKSQAYGTPPGKAGAQATPLSCCKLGLSPNLGIHVFTPPRAVKDSSTASEPTATPPCFSLGPDLKGSSMFPSSLSSSIADLSGGMKAMMEGDGEMELSNLDEELVKLLAWQRIQQLFPPKVPPIPQGSGLTAPPTTTVALKPQSPAPRTEEEQKVQARATFYPLMGKGGAINMSYRTLYIGAGADMDVCLTNYGHCNYVSGKHACIFYDGNTKHYELLNYSEHGTTVDNVLYSCDFSEKASPSPVSGLVSKVQGIVRHCKMREQEEGAEAVPGPRTGLIPSRGVMSCQPQGGPRLSCNCKASSSSLIGGSGAGWEGTALLHHGSYIKLGCMQFVFSIVEFTSKQPKEEGATGTANTTPCQEEADKQTIKLHQVHLGSIAQTLSLSPLCSQT